jgi:hypothetical protein
MGECNGKDKIFWGILILIVGLLFLGNNLGYISGSVWRWWPLLLILWGIKKLI